MDVGKTTWLYVVIVILVVALCLVFLFQNGAKNAGEMETIAERLAEQDKKLAEQGKRIAEQDERLAELEKIAKKVDEIQAALNSGKIDIKDYDMLLIREMIEEQVKLNVRSGDRPKIGVVNIQRIFLTCKGNAKYEGEAKAEKNKLDAELEKLGAEIKAEEAGLRTLKPGSSDHIAQVEEILTKQAGLRTKEELYKRRLELKYQLFIEGLYKDILRETTEVAKQKGLDLVQVKDEIEFPALSVRDAMMAIRTHKLLYSGELLDITDEVMARLDSEE